MVLPFRFYLISDRARMGPDPVAAAARLAAAGLPAMQWREKDLSAGENYAALSRLRESLGAESPLRLFVNDRADLARALSLDLHLPENALPTRAARGLLEPGALLGRSTHDPAGALAAEREGADFVTFGPVFDTPSKRSYGPPKGLPALAEVCRLLRIPVIALGGIDAGRIRECLQAGAYGVAVIGAVWNAEDPAEAVRELLARIDEAGR